MNMGKGRKNEIQAEWKANPERLLTTENKLRVDGSGENGWWALRRALAGMSTGCYM